MEETKYNTDNSVNTKRKITALQKKVRDKDKLIESLTKQVKDQEQTYIKHLIKDKPYEQQIEILKERYGIFGNLLLKDSNSSKTSSFSRVYQYLTTLAQLDESKIMKDNILPVAMKYKEGVEEIAAYNHLLKDRYVIIDADKKIGAYLDEFNNVREDNGHESIPSSICFLILSVTPRYNAVRGGWYANLT